MVNPHLLPSLIAGRDEPVGEVRIDLVRRHADCERLERHPLLPSLDCDGECDVIPRVLGHKTFPGPRREREKAFLSLYLTVSGLAADNQNRRLVRTDIREIKRSDVDRNCHPGVVRKDFRSVLRCFGNADFSAARNDKKQCQSQ